MRLNRLLSLGAALIAAACAGSAAPTPTSTATFSAIVVLAQPSCHPRPLAPCTIAVQAAIGNPDDRPLQFAWSGCASGTGSQAICRIESPGDVTAAVDVSDDRGHVVRAVASARGTNRPPAPLIQTIIWESAGSFVVFVELNDPDDEGQPFVCGRNPIVSVSGDCRGASQQCGGTSTGGNIEFSAIKTASSGTCSMTFTASDEWGVAGTGTKAVSYPR